MVGCARSGMLLLRLFVDPGAPFILAKWWVWSRCPIGIEHRMSATGPSQTKKQPRQRKQRWWFGWEERDECPLFWEHFTTQLYSCFFVYYLYPCFDRGFPVFFSCLAPDFFLLFEERWRGRKRENRLLIVGLESAQVILYSPMLGFAHSFEKLKANFAKILKLLSIFQIFFSMQFPSHDDVIDKNTDITFWKLEGMNCDEFRNILRNKISKFGRNFRNIEKKKTKTKFGWPFWYFAKHSDFVIDFKKW